MPEAQPTLAVPVIALTGGIASGKSTVAAMLAEMGAAVVDADLLARSAVQPGTAAHEQVIRSFGPAVVSADGTLDRARLGELVFSDSSARRRLEAIVHPRVAELSRQQIAAAQAGGPPLVVYQIPLLFETGREREFPRSLLVHLDPVTQLHRLRERSRMSEQEARARIEAQMPLAAKCALATWVVDNGGSVEQTRAQVEGLWPDLRGGSQVG